MTEIINEQQYEVAMQRIEELLPLVDDNTPTNDRNYIELDMISNLVSDYEEKYYKFYKSVILQKKPLLCKYAVSLYRNNSKSSKIIITLT